MPHSIITAGGDRKKLQRIVDFIVKNNICAIVVGLPVNMDGTSGSQAKIVTSFVNKLA
jgi:putative holliday junction resolvase